MARKCRIVGCDEDATWIMQPSGPGQTIVFSVPGHHYRGFPIVPVCDGCKSAIESKRQREIIFYYRNRRFKIFTFDNGESLEQHVL